MRHNIESGYNPDFKHKPVLWREIVDHIEGSYHKGEGILIDATLGEGGHSEILLNHFRKLDVLGFDRDGDILNIARERLRPFEKRVSFFNNNFSDIWEILDRDGINANYLLFDFGVSSYHFSIGDRGFSYASDAELDMRLNRDDPVDAAYIVNFYSEKKLADVIYRYGEERWAKRIASEICKRRRGKKIERTAELAEIVLNTIPKRFHVKNIHPATRVFQALRIEVNRELEAIEKSLDNFYRYLNRKGRMFAIAYHSLEDRIVKDRLRRLARGCRCRSDVKHCYCSGEPFVKIITKKPIRPEKDEIESNRSSRSSRLRICDKT